MKNAVLTTAFLAGGALAAAQEPSPLTSRPPGQTVEPTLASIQAAAATVKPSSPVSNVKGAGFDRIIQIWLENTDFNASAADPNMQWIAKHGITLTNYFAVTHPSEPNYAAVVGGDNFGMQNDDFNAFPANISTVVDLLDVKGITWSEYQEHMPYAGYLGYNYSNQETFANDYVRKHNPLILFDSVTKNASRIDQIKNLTSFYDDLADKKLPQWSFLTPNMTNDGHDTNITFSAAWTRGFLEPLLNNSYLMENTLIIVSFDETETYPIPNRVFTVLLGGAVDSSLHGTEDSMYYNHYSTISTVSVNWGLPSLGRWDCDANVLALVANKTGYRNTNISLDGLYFNQSYPGPMNDEAYTPGWWASPDTTRKCASGLGVLPSIKETWGESTGSYNYTNIYPYDELSGLNVGGTPTVGQGAASASNSSSGSVTGASGAAPAHARLAGALGFVGLLGAFLL